MKLRYKGAWIAAVAVLLGAGAVVGNASAQDEGARPERSAELSDARERLAEAAREVARLSAELTGPILGDVQRWFGGERRAILGLNIENAEGGVLVTGVTPGGPAASAGIETGDVIVAIDGAELSAGGDRSPADLLLAQMEHVAPGEPVELQLVRGDAQRTVTVEAGGFEPRIFSRPFEGARPWVDAERWAQRGLALPGRSSAWRGLELVTLTPGLGAYFGAEQGLLVVRAPEDNDLGLRDGDVVLDIGGRTPSSPEHAMRILASFEPGESLRLSIMRQQRRETVDLEAPTARTRR